MALNVTQWAKTIVAVVNNVIAGLGKHKIYLIKTF